MSEYELNINISTTDKRKDKISFFFCFHMLSRSLSSSIRSKVSSAGIRFHGCSSPLNKTQ